MKISEYIKCSDFPCQDIIKESHLIPNIEIVPANIRMLMISEVPPKDPGDYFYATGYPFYFQTTKQAFQDAGVNVDSIQDMLDLGIYITTAVKCAKQTLSVSTETIRNCAELLGKELDYFPNLKVIILNGDVAIKSLNHIARLKTKQRIIPPVSTYKIRGNAYYYQDMRVFPSYILTGKNFLIEKSKRKMISEDIMQALKLI